MAEKTEAVNSHNPVFTCFRSMAQTVMQFPPIIITKTRVKVCQLIGEMETKAPYKQNKPTASGCPYHNFSLSFHYQVLCYSSHGHVPPASSQLSTEVLSSLSPTTDSCSHVSPSESTPPQNGNEGRNTAGDEFDTDTSSFAEILKFGRELLCKLV